MTTNAAALYLRSSKDRKDVSPDAQRRALTELAAQRGLVVVAEFLDAVESGKDENRPGFQAMVKAVRDPNRGWDTVLLHDTSRLSRRRVISLIFEEIDCKQNGVGVVYKTLPDVDPLTEMLLKSILVAWDEYHSLISKQKGLAGMAENVRSGWRAGGRAPAGYVLQKVATGAVRDGQPVTKSVLALDPTLSDAIARYLRERAMNTPRAKAKENAGLSHVASNTLIGYEWSALTYAGHTVWNVQAERQGGRYVGGSKRRPRGEWVIQRDTHPALISDAEAEYLLGRLEKKAVARASNAHIQRDRDSSALLGGLLFAPDGGKWWAEADRYRWARAGKSKSISRASIDRQVVDLVMGDLASPSFAAKLLKSTQAALSNDAGKKQIRTLTAELSAIDAKISQMMDLAAQMNTPAPALRKIEALEQQRAAQQAELKALQAELAESDWVASITESEVTRVLASIIEDAKEAGRSEMLRPVISAVVDRIELDPETLQGSLCYRVAPNKSGVKVASPRGFEPRSHP